MRKDVKAGHDGTWVAHPGLVAVARQVFDEWMPGPNQIDTAPSLKRQTAADDLLEIPLGNITDLGFERNVEISLVYLESWLRGLGCVPIFHLTEDAATAEISRAQLWQWNRYASRTAEGTLIDDAAIAGVMKRTLLKKQTELGANYQASKFSRAAELLLDFTKGPFRYFLTIELYAELA